MRPTTFDEFVGNEQVKSALQVASIAATNNIRALPHILLLGTAGTGKTTLANIVANQTGRRFIRHVGSDFATSQEAIRIIAGLGLFSILFIDEIHLIPRAVQDTMLPIMEDFLIPTDAGMVHVPPFTIIGATTNPEKLVKPFKDRCKYNLFLRPYVEKEIRDIITGHLDNIEITTEALSMLIGLARGTARIAVNLATVKLADFCSTFGITEIDEDHIIQLMAINSLYPKGLTQVEMDYLSHLMDGPRSAKMMDTKMGGPISQEAEEYLIRLGFVNISGRGREVTQEGKNYVRSVY